MYRAYHVCLYRCANDSQSRVVSAWSESFRLRYGPLATAVITLTASLLTVATAGGNFLVIAAFKVDSQLQRVNNYFLLSLPVTDLDPLTLTLTSDL